MVERAKIGRREEGRKIDVEEKLLFYRWYRTVISLYKWVTKGLRLHKYLEIIQPSLGGLCVPHNLLTFLSKFPLFFLSLPNSIFDLSAQYPHNYLLFHFSTFTFWNESAPHHLAFLQMACDGVSPLRLDEALLTNHRDGASQLETVPKAPGIQWYARVRALIMPESL